jgi:hypothetical protein
MPLLVEADDEGLVGMLNFGIPGFLGFFGGIIGAMIVAAAMT